MVFLQVTKGLRLFPATRFAYACLTIMSVIANKRVFREITYDDEWEANTSGIAEHLVQAFVQTVVDDKFNKKCESLVLLLTPIFAALHFLEGDSVTVGCVYIMFQAIVKVCARFYILLLTLTL